MKHFLSAFFFLACSTLLTAQVSIQTKIPAINPNSEVTIEIKINKGAVLNFAKFQLDVPAGVYVSEGDNKTGSFSFENNRAKIIWVSIPPEPEFTVTMRLNPGTVKGVGTINQKFYYLENGTRKEVEAMPISINFGGNEAVISTNLSTSETIPASVVVNNEPVENKIAPEDVPAETPADNTIVERVTETVGAETSPQTSTESSAEAIEKLKEQFDATNAAATKTVASVPANPTSTPALLNGVTYKVQIGAFGENPGMARFSALNNVKIITEANYYKVLVGDFKNKEDAVKAKDDLATKGFKGFIVTFQNGMRVK